MKRLLLALLLICLFSEQVIDAAYNPFEPDIVQVTNTAVTNINTAAQTEFNNINTTVITNTDSDVFTSVASNGVVCVPGTYLVDVVVYHTTTAQRANVALEVTVDSISTGIRGAGGYMRSLSGHNEASTSVRDLVTLTSSGKIGFDTLRLAVAGNVAVPVGQSSMRIARIDD